MIDVATTWQQVCEALAVDDYSAALELLSRSLESGDKLLRAQVALYLASVYTLYGDGRLEELSSAVKQALAFDPSLYNKPLYLALSAELDARKSGAEATIPKGIFSASEPLASYHAIAALALAEHAQDVLNIDLPLQKLPSHLRWRLRSWQAGSYEQLGQLQEASRFYAEAAEYAQGINKAVMLQEEAALLLQLGQLQTAQHRLDAARVLYTESQSTENNNPNIDKSEESLNLATWHYLKAQVLLNLGHPEAAEVEIREADRLERIYGDSSYGVALVLGQILTHLNRYEEALEHFERALELALDSDRCYAHHELGVTLLDLDRPVEAREHLEAVLADAYPYQAEVLADIAECDYRLGRLQEAEQTAEQALKQGAIVPASLVLGSVALDYYHLEDALEHYERVTKEAVPGSPDWITGHQLAADIMAQQGFLNPAAAYAHAQQALEHMQESDDWYATLQGHLQKAEVLISTHNRHMLN